jgi:hypothetical protein
MKRVNLTRVRASYETGQECPDKAPNIKEDCIFYSNGKPVGFFLTKMPEKANALVSIANKEFLSNRVPKKKMNRTEKDSSGKRITKMQQYSTLLGSIPAKPQFARPYPTMSIVHSRKSAEVYIKAMLALSIECENIIKETTPELYYPFLEIMNTVPPEWKFGNLFTSSISNYNISANYHIDRANIVGSLNVIITKRENSSGGCLYIPDYDATIDQIDGSMLVYPAWRNYHGVTPINSFVESGYRNSFVFYALNYFTTL